MLDSICMGFAEVFVTGREQKFQNENIFLQRDSNPRHSTLDREISAVTTRFEKKNTHFDFFSKCVKFGTSLLHFGKFKTALQSSMLTYFE